MESPRIHPRFLGNVITKNAFLHGNAFLVSCKIPLLLLILLLGMPLQVTWAVPTTVTTTAGMPAESAQDTHSCFVGQYNSKIVPEQVRIFVAAEKGNITHLIQPSGRVPKGTVFGKMNQDELALEKEDIEMNLLKDKLAKEEEIIKQEREKKEILYMMSVPSSERKWIQDGKYKKGDKQIIKNIDDKIELAKTEFAVTSKKKRAEFKKKEEAYTFIMPFDGRLQYQFTLPDKLDANTAQYTESGREIAIACDDSNFYLSISISNPEITKINPKNFVLQLELSNGRIIKGTYSHKRVEKSQGSQGGEMLAFFFRLPQENHDEIYEMTGTNPISKLYYKTEQDVEMLNKMDIASKPEAKEANSWQELLNKIMPEYEVVLVGETQIIVRKK